ncbi:MAG TPA: ABC transporter substrate-binding protein [Candidatus Binatia bacterium]|nr:ABC transporter substrate-binding protein [Candidatus Binatia bacterium]
MRNCKSILNLSFWYLTIAYCLLPIASWSADAPLKKMRFVQSGATSSSWPIYVAQQKKLFEKNGLDMEVIVIRGSTNLVRAVISNSVPMGRINPDYVIGGIEKGAKLKIVSGIQDKIAYDFMARPEIKTGADLKGKTIGVSTLTGGTTLMIEEVLEKAYKLKEGEYKYLVVGTSPERYAALKGGSVQATFMGAPFNFRAAKEGFNKLITFHEVLGPIQFTVDFAHQDYVKSHRDEIIRYLKSTIEATDWLYDRKNKEEALAIHMKALKTTRDAAEQDYKFMVEDFKPFTRGGAVVKAAWDKTMELRAKEGHYKGKKVPAMTDYVDTSLIEEAQKLAGFKP